jgi:SAM-dependent methyltransferase
MRVTALKQATYDASVFTNIETVDDAVRIILTPEAGMTSVHRWKTETPYLMTLIEKHIKGGTVLDYGCGIGRLSKPLIEKHGCTVIGADISPNMRALAASCVDSDLFFALHPDMLLLLGPSFAHAAIAVWTLQHCFAPKDDISNIHRALGTAGTLFIVNNVRRVVPVSDGHNGRWADDQIDINALICQSGFDLIERGQLDGDDIAPGTLRDSTFWAAYRKT